MLCFVLVCADRFVLKNVVYYINLPCVKSADLVEYCLPAFSALTNLVSTANGQFTTAQLDPAQGGVCRECARRFFLALTAYSQAAAVRQWRPIFLICLQDRVANVYCLPGTFCALPLRLRLRARTPTQRKSPARLLIRSVLCVCAVCVQRSRQ